MNTKSRKLGKRGSLQDLILVITILMTVGITIIIASMIANKVNDSNLFDDDVTGTNQSQARTIYGKTMNSVLPTFDNIFVGVVIAGILGTILLAFAVRSPTAFFIAGFIFIIILVMLAAIMSNVYDEVADHPNLAQYSAPYTAMEFIMSNLPLVILVAGAAISIVLYGLWRIGV